MSSKRPELVGPPELFYDENEARKYTNNSHMIAIQAEMSERALELLALPDDSPRFILDIGCGSGLSGEVLSENDHVWVGLDISRAMLDVAIERESEGDLILTDMGLGIPFRPGTFDGAISISALQWLCNADRKDQNPVKRMSRFFTSLYACLSRGSRAVFQFYPNDSSQIELLTQQSMKAGFSGGLVIDFPNSSKAKKMFLVLLTGGHQTLPKGLGTESESDNRVTVINRRNVKKRERRGRPLKKSKEWIVNKKERARRQGKDVRPDSKYTGRRRLGHF